MSYEVDHNTSNQVAKFSVPLHFKNSVDVAGTEMYSHCQIFSGDECFRHNTYPHLFFERTLLLITNVLSKNILCFWGKHDPFQDKRVSC